jgi:hypothetical protein
LGEDSDRLRFWAVVEFPLEETTTGAVAARAAPPQQWQYDIVSENERIARVLVLPGNCDTSDWPPAGDYSLGELEDRFDATWHRLADFFVCPY